MAHIHAELLETAEDLAGFGTWSMSLANGEVKWSRGMYRILGQSPTAAPPTFARLIDAIHPDDRARVRRAIEHAVADPGDVPVKGMLLEYRVVRPDGAVRIVRGCARMVRDDRGWRWFGVEQDVTDQRLSERELRAYYAVSQALREWESFEEGVVDLLRRMVTALEFSSAAMWSWDDANQELVCRAVYAAPDIEATEWEAVTKSLTFRPGEGLAGKAWVTGEPIVSPDVQRDPDFRRPGVASEAGIGSALVFPAKSNGEAVAVLAFYSMERRDSSERLVRTLSGIASSLGRFLYRRRGQLQPSPLSARELEVLGLAAEGLSGPQIAERLIVSPSTIKTHFENIYEKLGIGDRAGAVAYALRIGLIS